MSISLDSIVNKIEAYEAIFRSFGFTSDGAGRRAWSVRYVTQQGMSVEVAGSGYVLQSSAGAVLHEGNTPQQLKEYLLRQMTHEQLLAYAARS